MKSLRVALFCEEAAGARVLEALARDGHRVALLLARSAAVARLAARHGVVPLDPARVREPGFAGELERSAPDLILNVHSLHLVPAAVLEVPPLGAYNLHPGPLPGYAGLNAPSWALYRGEERHGVTVHRMAPGIDTGAVIYEESFALTTEDTGLSVALRCAARGVELVRGLLRQLAADPAALPERPQDPAQRRYFGRGAPQSGRIDWNAPARRIRDFVRACDYAPFASPWGTPRARLAGAEVEVSRVAFTGERCDASPGTLRRDGCVATADEWLRLS